MNIDPDDIRALVGYVEQRAGITDVSGCGCHGRIECGYHREQRLRNSWLRELVAELGNQGPAA